MGGIARLGSWRLVDAGICGACDGAGVPEVLGTIWSFPQLEFMGVG